MIAQHAYSRNILKANRFGQNTCQFLFYSVKWRAFICFFVKTNSCFSTFLIRLNWHDVLLCVYSNKTAYRKKMQNKKINVCVFWTKLATVSFDLPLSNISQLVLSPSMIVIVRYWLTSFNFDSTFSELILKRIVSFFFSYVYEFNNKFLFATCFCVAICNFQCVNVSPFILCNHLLWHVYHWTDRTHGFCYCSKLIEVFCVRFFFFLFFYWFQLNSIKLRFISNKCWITTQN